jgi:hypothetical protein
MHIVTMLEAQSGNVTLSDKAFDMTQQFVRRVMEPSSACASQLPPMLLHMDDYLGNEQREIWATTELSQGVQVLANYYGFASASYADVVRDFVYGDSHEYWFSPQGWYDEQGEFAREIHPGMGMHIVAAWVVAYNFLNIITAYCSLEAWNLNSASIMEYNGTTFTNLPVLRGKFWPPGKPERPPLGLKPLLTKDLSLEHITQLWKRSSSNDHGLLGQPVTRSTACDDSSGAAKCPFSWLSGVSSTQAKPAKVEKLFRENTQFSGDWTFVDDHDKLGIAPPGLGSFVTIELPQVTQTIRKITVFYMKSYGERWAGSKVRAQVSRHDRMDGGWEKLKMREFVGYHDKHTSETYTELLDLSYDPIEPGNGLRLQITLIGGNTFKIMGLAICS